MKAKVISHEKVWFEGLPTHLVTLEVEPSWLSKLFGGKSKTIKLLNSGMCYSFQDRAWKWLEYPSLKTYGICMEAELYCKRETIKPFIDFK
jgi:hypothetical protein